MAKKPLLKDRLFNQAKVKQIADEIQRVYPQFDKNSFAERIVERFPHLELKERIAWISENLHAFLPTDYREATSILLASLPPPNDNTKTDNDFGDFIYAPYAEFVARNGVTKKDLYFSLAALKEITMRFSVEDAIRRFINAFPKETMQELQKWSNDSHYHVRRLTSEGTRPKLPWSQKIIIAPEQAIPILDNLFSDKTRYVTRSVANHINDISKSDPKLAITTLQRWQKSGKQNPKEMNYVINHALRTLIKQGNKDAMKFLHFSTSPEVEILSNSSLTMCCIFRVRRETGTLKKCSS
jgi:3-methyladenine DNA glycosylase AlkC